ncbi:MAG: hypothetical protein ACK4NF_06550, partial [Planctomycetota bacterium]
MDENIYKEVEEIRKTIDTIEQSICAIERKISKSKSFYSFFPFRFFSLRIFTIIAVVVCIGYCLVTFLWAPPAGTFGIKWRSTNASSVMTDRILIEEVTDTPKIHLFSDDATAGTINSPRLNLTGSYWTGTTAAFASFKLQNIISSTAPTYRLAFLDNAGTEVANITQQGYLHVADGTAGAPSISFKNDTNTGIFRVAADTIGFSAGGVNLLTLSPSSLTLTSPLVYLAPAGSAGAPSYSFSVDTNTGMYYSSAAGTLNFATAGISRLQIGRDVTVPNPANLLFGYTIQRWSDASSTQVRAGCGAPEYQVISGSCDAGSDVI